MGYSKDRLDNIYDKTGGYCHICHKKIARRNYGKTGRRGAWQVDHSNPRANGGSDSLNNFFAACVSCNASKGAKSTRSQRRKNGKVRSPYSQKEKQAIIHENTVLGSGTGLIAGAIAGGVRGGVIGAVIGGILGSMIEPEQENA